MTVDELKILLAETMIQLAEQRKATTEAVQANIQLTAKVEELEKKPKRKVK